MKRDPDKTPDSQPPETIQGPRDVVVGILAAMAFSGSAKENRVVLRVESESNERLAVHVTTKASETAPDPDAPQSRE